MNNETPVGLEGAMVQSEPMQPGTPIQQLGAAPGTPILQEGVPGHRDEPEDMLEFASSGEAEDAPRDGEDYDQELSEEMLNASCL